MRRLRIEDLWRKVGFKPTDNQAKAIRHIEGPLYLTAGPGSGKTRVLLWRTLNLIVFHEINPEQIFLSTFTEKAAHQLKEGLRALLGLVTNLTNRPYDVSKMYVGTVHSLCQRIISDRRFYSDPRRPRSVTLLDGIGQYLYLYNRSTFDALLSASRCLDVEAINEFFGKRSSSRHVAVTNCIALFNRLSEECLNPRTVAARAKAKELRALIKMYEAYIECLDSDGTTSQVDFSLLQRKALDVLESGANDETVFRHIIVDEYQDTNTIQEKLFFTLARGHKNICVVGDDDQALYRFRGATVENFVEFPKRCEAYLGTVPQKLPLSVNYRSRNDIVSFYTRFIEQCDWKKPGTRGYYRVIDKNITAFNRDRVPSVVASSNTSSEQVASEIADLVKKLIDTGKVNDPNQIAFLYPSLKSVQVGRMRAALERRGLRVYAPRAGRFLEVEEAVDVFGILLEVFGRPERGEYTSRGYEEFQDWMDRCLERAKDILRADSEPTRFVRDRRREISAAICDYQILTDTVKRSGWEASQYYNPERMKARLAQSSGLSAAAKKNLTSPFFERIVRERAAQGRPFTLSYIIARAASLDWNVLDLFYRISGFDQFRKLLDLAEEGRDEGPTCNLALITGYLARFMDQYSMMLTGRFLANGQFQRALFTSYLYALFRLGESEYEDADDPFPKGRIPFLTIHQAKGLEFPVVVLGSPRKDDRGPQYIETLMRPLTEREGEPLGRLSEFDAMRMFYVALSRAKNLLVIAHPRGPGISTHRHFASLLDSDFPRIPDFDIRTVPAAEEETGEIPKTYSYTGDYLLFQKCPRQYMLFRKYGFVASRSQTQLFGNLVHQTIEDLHHLLILRRSPGGARYAR